MAMKNYKNIRIIRAKNGDWRVRYQFRIPGKNDEFKYFYVRDGINYIRDPEKKEEAAQKLASDIAKALKKGYNPFLAQNTINFQIDEGELRIATKDYEEAKQPWTLTHALKQFFDNAVFKELSIDTLKTYRSYSNILRNWLNDNNLLDVLASKFTETEAEKYLFDKSPGWSARTYNNHAAFLPIAFAEMRKLERKLNSKKIQYEGDFSDLPKKVSRAEKHKAYSGEVAKMIKRELSKYPALDRYIKWIYFSCMRPIEIRNMRVENINLETRQIKINGKTGFRIVPISDELAELIGTMNIHEHHYNHFVFGENGAVSPIQAKSKYYADNYKRLIKDHLKIDPNYTAYGWKHTRVIDLISSGFTDYEVMSLTGHADYDSFQKYKRELVIDNKAMKGKTTGF